MARNIEMANSRLTHTLNNLRSDVDEPRRSNIVATAQSRASSAHASGERYHAGNNTTYPAKHYGAIEDIFGVMSAPELCLFDDAYNAYMAWHSDVR